MKLIITSEHRVGSRWIHYLLADLLGMKTSPEIDVKTLWDDALVKIIKGRLSNGIIVKFHHATQDDILKTIKPHDYNILGIVRNPRDRLVSLAFHNKYHPYGKFPEQDFDEDLDAVRFTVLESNAAKGWTENQFNLMERDYSTRNKVNFDKPYIWTSYRWLLDDTAGEIEKILSFIGVYVNDRQGFLDVINKHSFKTKSGRRRGKEKRDDYWRRKGVMKDWKNWFDDEMIEATEEVQNKYWEILNLENANSRKGR